MIVERQLGRQMALQALFEIDSVGHAPGTVVDARLASPVLGEEFADPDITVGAETARYLRWLVSGVVQNRQRVGSAYRPLCAGLACGPTGHHRPQCAAAGNV